MQSVSSTGKVNGTHRDIIASEKGLSGTDDLGNTTNVLCPPGSFVSGIQGLKAGNQTLSSPIIQLRYACRPLK